MKRALISIPLNVAEVAPIAAEGVGRRALSIRGGFGA
jgi:hypothetical protein